VKTSFRSTLERVFGFGVIESLTPVGLVAVGPGGVVVVADGDAEDVGGGDAVGGGDDFGVELGEIIEEDVRLGMLTKVGGALAPGR
jgi:hypothetical protein